MLLSLNAFIDRLYLLALGRNADERGAEHWIEVLSQGGRPYDVALGLVNSAEFASLHDAGVTSEYFLERYAAHGDLRGDMERHPDRIEDIAQTLVALASDDKITLVSNEKSQETNALAAIVEPPLKKIDPFELKKTCDRLFGVVFDREIDAVGFSYWADQFRKGAEIGDIAQAIAESAEFAALYGTAPKANVLVAALYYNGMLHAPDDATVAFWQAEIENRRNYSDLIVSVVKAVEKQEELAEKQLDRIGRPMPNRYPLLRPPANIVFLSGEPRTTGHHYRVLRAAQLTERLGAKTLVLRSGESASYIDEILACDVLILWRAAWETNVAAAIRAAQSRGALVGFDVDDLMIEPRLVNVKIIDGIRSQGYSEKMTQEFCARVRETMNAADFCVTTTEELAVHMRRRRKPTFVIPNGFDEATLTASRAAYRRRATSPSDGLVRIGYAGGTRTHQHDFLQAVGALARVLREKPESRLVLFRSSGGVPFVDLSEYPELEALQNQVEWREAVDLATLPQEIARFDINIAPLETGNPFCEAKSELKFFEASLAGVATIASPTGPYLRCIMDGQNGFIAHSEDQWRDRLIQLVEEPELRAAFANAAYLTSLSKFGPLSRTDLFEDCLANLQGGRTAARSHATSARKIQTPQAPIIPDYKIVAHFGGERASSVAVVIPLYNYQAYIREALESVKAQTLEDIELIVVDDCSTDQSLGQAHDWIRQNSSRFTRAVLVQNVVNSGLAASRNVGFSLADTLFVLPLDADNRLLPHCAERLVATIRKSGAAFCYPTIQEFGATEGQISAGPYDPQRLAQGNYIDAMALVSVEAWARVGGYHKIPFGWEDYDFWCLIAEQGWFGEWVPEVLAEYRVHTNSMLRTKTDIPENKAKVIRTLEERHPWLRIPRPI